MKHRVKRFYSLLLVPALAVCLMIGLSACTGSKEKGLNAFMEGDLNIMDFGAVGDGITNDLQAFEDGIRAAKEQGARLYFPEGTYRLEDSCVVPDSVTLVLADNAKISLDAECIVNINGTLHIGDRQHIFDGEGSFRLGGYLTANPFWVGAKGDGVTDDTLAFKKAWESCAQINLPYTENGYLLSEMETFSNMALVGISQGDKKPILKAAADCEILFHTQTGEGNYKISNVQVDMSAAPDGSTVFHYNTDSGWIQDIYVDNCVFTDAYHVFTDSRVGKDSNSLMYVHLEDILCKDSRNSTFKILDFEGFIFMKRFTIDNSNSFTKHNLTDGFTAVWIDEVRGNILEEITIIGGNSGYDNEIGFSYKDIASVWYDRVTVKNCSGPAIRLLDYNILVSLIDVTVENCGGGVYATGSGWMQLERVHVSGRSGQADAKGNAHGIMIQNGRIVQMHDISSTNNTGSGLVLRASNLVSVNKATLCGNDSHGYYDYGSSKTVLTNATLTGNKKGQVKNMTALSSMENLILEEGGQPVSFTGIKTQ